MDSSEERLTAWRAAGRYATWQLGSERDILRFSDQDEKDDGQRARTALAARPQDRYIGRQQTSPGGFFVAGESCVTPLTDAMIENAAAMVVKDRPLTREQFEAVGAIGYEMIADRPWSRRRYLQRWHVHGVRSGLGRAFIEILQRLAVLDVLRADVAIEEALAAYPPGRHAYRDFGHLLYTLRQWTMNDLQEARRAAKRERKDPPHEEERWLDFYAGATPAPIRRDSIRRDLDDEPDQDQPQDAGGAEAEDDEIERLTRLLPAVDAWLQGQRETLSREIAALDTLPPAKPWARPMMLKGSNEKKAWLRGRRNRLNGTWRTLPDSGKLPVTAADWERMRVDDAIGDFLADEQTVERLHDRLAVLKSIRRWNDRITPFAHRIKHFGDGARPRHISVGRRAVAPSAPGPRHGVWPRGYTSSTPVPLAKRIELRRGRGGDTTPGAVPLIEHLDLKGWGCPESESRRGTWNAQGLQNGPWSTPSGWRPASGDLNDERVRRAVGDIAIPPAPARACCATWLDKKEHDTACNEHRWRRSYF